MDLDLRGTPDEVAEKAALFAAGLSGSANLMGEPSKPGPGRPKLGVVGREVTLLPRHWDWLSAQHIRKTQDIAYRFMYAIAGDLPGFEEAARALYAWDLGRLESLIGGWPPDIRDHVTGIVRRAP